MSHLTPDQVLVTPVRKTIRLFRGALLATDLPMEVSGR